ncbi:resolvase [Alkalibaculum sp. M08DMB]|uniref:Resolvase n=1 Tax=Alkalibaculum sporogenes TaxID=2655001 RepID=A0A6A7KA98_9FIRM|nr:recombinase family protein [Alkalibaculum sporogenes]MPW26438.1 resolvase [Alkalibaculum sporogenes]
MKIAIYSRKSIETDTGESIKNQINMCKEYFNHKYSDCKFEIFEDEGFSGGNINRPDFKRMMELVKFKQFDVVAVYKIDRIARNIVDFVNVYDELDKMGVQLVSITEGFDPTTPAGKMMMLLLASFSEMERMNISQRVRDNMRELAKLGYWSGGSPPTGYNSTRIDLNGKSVAFLVANDELVNIKTIFEMYASGHFPMEITNYFKEKGFNYPTDSILDFIKNPTYLKSTPESIHYLKQQGYKIYGEPNECGFLPYNRRPRKNGIRFNGEKIVGVSTHVAIIDIDLWIRTQQKLKERFQAPRPRESQFSWLSGLVKCRCGSGMYVINGHKRKDGTRPYSFKCSANAKDSTLCNNRSIRVERVESEVLAFLERLLNREELESLSKSNDNLDVDKNIKLLHKKIDSNTSSINNLIDKLMILSNEASDFITKKIEQLSKETNTLKDELLKFERSKFIDNLDKKNIDVLHQQITNFLELENDVDLKRNNIRSIIKSIIWDSEHDKISIEIVK